MSTYLVGLVISDFECLDERVENLGLKGYVDVRVCGRVDALKAGQLDYALNVSVRVIKFFEEFYKVKYPLSKCGMPI